MTKQEFETLTGQKVTDARFEAINEAYMRTELTKQEFCLAWGDGKCMDIIGVLLGQINMKESELQDCEKRARSNKAQHEATAYTLLDMAEKKDDAQLKQVAMNALGFDAVVRYDVEKGYRLNEDERAYILHNLK